MPGAVPGVAAGAAVEGGAVDGAGAGGTAAGAAGATAGGAAKTMPRSSKMDLSWGSCAPVVTGSGTGGVVAGAAAAGGVTTGSMLSRTGSDLDLFADSIGGFHPSRAQIFGLFLPMRKFLSANTDPSARFAVGVVGDLTKALVHTLLVPSTPRANRFNVRFWSQSCAVSMCVNATEFSLQEYGPA